jgi:hypothetical protein
MAYNHTSLLTLTPVTAPDGLPPVIDDVSLAFSLGIKTRTMWWMVTDNDYKKIMGGTGMYELFHVPKKSGGHRPIHAPCERLKEVQKTILVKYLDPLPLGQHVGAFVPGRSLNHTTQQHVGSAEQLHLDLKDFFTSTRRRWVRDWVRSLGYPKGVARPLATLMTVPVKLPSGHIVGVVPQGAPTSGALTNQIASERIDRPILAYLEVAFGTGGATYTRYADDLVISFPRPLTSDERFEVRTSVIDLIIQAGYMVNFKKVHTERANHPKRPMKVLGQVTNKHLNVPRSKYRKLRAITNNVLLHGFHTQYTRYGRENAEAMIQGLRGELTYWNSVNPDRIGPLLAKFDQALQDWKNRPDNVT